MALILYVLFIRNISVPCQINIKDQSQISSHFLLHICIAFNFIRVHVYKEVNRGSPLTLFTSLPSSVNHKSVRNPIKPLTVFVECRLRVSPVKWVLIELRASESMFPRVGLFQHPNKWFIWTDLNSFSHNQPWYRKSRNFATRRLHEMHKWSLWNYVA